MKPYLSSNSESWKKITCIKIVCSYFIFAAEVLLHTRPFMCLMCTGYQMAKLCMLQNKMELPEGMVCLCTHLWHCTCA